MNVDTYQITIYISVTADRFFFLSTFTAELSVCEQLDCWAGCKKQNINDSF